MNLKNKLQTLKKIITQDETINTIYPSDILACIGEFPSSANDEKKYRLYRSLETGASISSEPYQIPVDNTIERTFPYILYSTENGVMGIPEFDDLRDYYEGLKNKYPGKTRFQLYVEMKQYQELKKKEQEKHTCKKKGLFK